MSWCLEIRLNTLSCAWYIAWIWEQLNHKGLTKDVTLVCFNNNVVFSHIKLVVFSNPLSFLLSAYVNSWWMFHHTLCVWTLKSTLTSLWIHLMVEGVRVVSRERTWGRARAVALMVTKRMKIRWVGDYVNSVELILWICGKLGCCLIKPASVSALITLMLAYSQTSPA